MKKVLFAFATLLFVACGNKVQQPELVEEDISLPEYKLLSTEEPKLSSNGIISPGQNLVYNILIINGTIQKKAVHPRSSDAPLSFV